MLFLSQPSHSGCPAIDCQTMNTLLSIGHNGWFLMDILSQLSHHSVIPWLSHHSSNVVAFFIMDFLSWHCCSVATGTRETGKKVLYLCTFTCNIIFPMILDIKDVKTWSGTSRFNIKSFKWPNFNDKQWNLCLNDKIYEMSEVRERKTKFGQRFLKKFFY